MPGGASCKATATNCATLAARTWLFAAGTMYLKTDSIQWASPGSTPGAAAGAGFCADRMISKRSKPNAAYGLLVQVGETTLQGFGQPALGMRQDDGQVPAPLRRIHCATSSSCPGWASTAPVRGRRTGAADRTGYA
jgi:hypothetical protein